MLCTVLIGKNGGSRLTFMTRFAIFFARSASVSSFVLSFILFDVRGSFRGLEAALGFESSSSRTRYNMHTQRNAMSIKLLFPASNLDGSFFWLKSENVLG